MNDLRLAGLPGAARLALADGVVHLDPASAVFEAMLEGWATQQRARFLKDNTIGPRLELVRRFAVFTNQYPWQWEPAEAEAFITRSPVAVSTARNYQNTLRLFCGYASDARYGSWATCSGCGNLAPVKAGTRDQPLCADCAAPGAGFWKACPGCGDTGRLLAGGACRRCHLRDQVDRLLADPGTGRTRAGLEPLRQALAGVGRPEVALGWIRRDKVRALLTGLAAGHRPLTHAVLDELPDSKTLRHLRSVLVASGAFPARDEHLIQLERWIRQAVAARPDAGQKQLLHSYATWHVLRRLRQRLRGTPATHNQAYTARHHVTAAIAFLDWLAARGLTLAACAQGDLDAWMATASTARKGATGHFVRWARSRKHTSLDFPATRWNGPARTLDTEARWDRARRLLHDKALDPGDRFAGLLVLLYAQQPAAISRLTLGNIDIGDGQVLLHLGQEPIRLAEPLDELARQLIATRRGHATIGDRGTSPWLLPGGRPGRPISAYRLSERLHQIGIRPGPARSTALFQLAAEVPAAILARMLGIHINVAVAWQHASNGDWAAYAADISRRNAPGQAKSMITP